MNDRSRISRRRFGALMGGTLAALSVGSLGALSATCSGASGEQMGGDGRLRARPKPGVKTTASGHKPLGLGGARDALLHIPPNPTGPLPLLVLLHGAGSSGAIQVGRFGSVPDEAGVAVLSPDSRGPTWDGIRGGFGPDVAFLDRALSVVFDTVDIDPKRLTIGGFSDGASYAVSLGLINGDLFPRVLAMSPGFVVPGTPHGKPKFFVSHGTADDVLPIDRCGRVIVANLKQNGYDVTFREFDGKHEVTPAVQREAFKWVAS